MNNQEGSYNTYIGARYVPIFDGTWDNTKKYEPLVIVEYEGNSYTSKTYVPIGIDINNTEYWALTGNYNAQVEAYRQEVQNVKNELTNKVDKVNSTLEPSSKNGVMLTALNENNPILEVRSLKVNDQGGMSIGLFSGMNNSGESNTFIGDFAGQDNTTGQRNTAVGTFSQFRKTTGQYNTAVGYVTESKNTTGNYNTSLGYGAFENSVTGYDNTNIGAHALQANVEGILNTSVGYFSNYSSLGSYNTAVGGNSGRTVVNGDNNVYVGYNSDVSSNDLSPSNSIAIGVNSKISGNLNVAVGANSSTSGNYSISVGSIPASERETIIGHPLTNMTKIRGGLYIPTELLDDNFVVVNEGEICIFLSKLDGKLKVKFSDNSIKIIAFEA